jgi:hypothetical protein
MESVAEYSTTLNTDLRRFGVWAVSAIRDVDGWQLKVPGRPCWFKLTRGRGLHADEITGRFPIEGWIYYDGDLNPAPRDGGVFEVFMISAWSPSPDRVIVTLRCLHPGTEPLIDVLRDSLLRCWPEGKGDSILPTSPEHDTNSTVTPSEAQPKPGYVVHDEAYREMVRLWNGGMEAPDIGHRFNMQPSSVQKRISDLRKVFGPEVVKYKRADKRRLM